MAASNTTFQSQFITFSKYGDSKADGKNITLSQSDKWMKQAKVFGKKITTTDTAICFNKFRQRNLNLVDYDKFINDIAASKGMNPDEIREKMTNCGAPGSNATQAVRSNVVGRLTDTSQYTGAHKERFDSAGRGRGAEGRRDTQQNTGYVQGYNPNETHDKTPEK